MVLPSKTKNKKETKTTKNNGMDCMMMSCPTKRYKQINNVIQAECSRSTPRHAWSKLFFNKPPSSLQARLLQGHGGMGIWSARDDGWIPRRIWGEIRDAARSLFLFFCLFWGQMKMKREAFKALCLHVSLPLRLGCVVSQMPGTNPLALPYLRYCRRHLSQCHSGGMWGRWMMEEVVIRGEDKKKMEKHNDAGKSNHFE